MSDEKKEHSSRKVPQVTWNILAIAEKVRSILPMAFAHGTEMSHQNWILEVNWAQCSLSEFATKICEAELDRVPIVLNPEQTSKLWCYLAFYYEAYRKNNKEFYHKQHKAPDFAIVSALFRETDWSAIGLMDDRGIETRILLSQAMNLLYCTRYADVVHAHFVVELQMIFATLRKQEEGPDEPPRHISAEEKFAIQNNWLTFCNFVSLVSDIDSLPSLKAKNKNINVLGDLKLMVQSLMRYVSFGLQYVYENVKKMPGGEELCDVENYYDALYEQERENTLMSSQEVPVIPYLLTSNNFRINPVKGCNELDIAGGLHQFAKIFVNPWFQSLLAYFNLHTPHINRLMNRRWHHGEVKSVKRMLQKANDRMQQKPERKEEDFELNSSELLGLHDICRSSFCFQLPAHFLKVIKLLQDESRSNLLKHLEVIRIINLFNEDASSLKKRREIINKKIKESTFDPKFWSQEGIMHYRNVKIDVKITLPESVTYIDRKGNAFSGSDFIGEIELLMDSYLYAKKETHRYWKLQRIRQSKNLLTLPLWEHPDIEKERKFLRKRNEKDFTKQAAWLRSGSEHCWRAIKKKALKYVDDLNKKEKGKQTHEIRFTKPVKE